jgi:hypothetical protein
VDEGEFEVQRSAWPLPSNPANNLEDELRYDPKHVLNRVVLDPRLGGAGRFISSRKTDRPPVGPAGNTSGRADFYARPSVSFCVFFGSDCEVQVLSVLANLSSDTEKVSLRVKQATARRAFGVAPDTTNQSSLRA